MAGDGAYFGHRAHEERLAAMQAVSPAARDAHLELALRYADLSQAITDREWHLGLDLFNDDDSAAAAPASG